MQDKNMQGSGASDIGFDLEKIYHLTSDIICVADLRGIFFKRVNPAFTRILGYDQDEACSKLIAGFIHPDDRERTLAAITEEFKLGKETLNFVNRYEHKNGGYVWIEWRTKPLPEEGMTYAVGRDITERRRMEQELLKMQKLESIGLLAGGIAHDFNNLLMAIMGNISYSRSLLAPTEKASSLLADAEQACWAAKDLSNRLLTFSRGGEPLPKVVALEHIVRDSAGIAFAGWPVSFSVEMSSDLPLVEIDVSQIRQVLSNLLINAREAMPKGGRVEIRAQEITLEEGEQDGLPPGRYFHLSIQDDGMGIPEENLHRIFDPYFSTKERSSHKGRGLGLAICHSIVSKHKGRIVVQSAVGKGSTFTVCLPASAHQVQAVEAPQPGNGQEAPARGKILVMDDDERVSWIVGEMLRSLHYIVETATGGSQAVDLYAEAKRAGAPFAVVLLDLTVPGGMGAMDTIKKLREIEPSVRAIVSSGYDEHPIMQVFESCGFAAAITKPYNLDQLRATLVRVLGKDTGP